MQAPLLPSLTNTMLDWMTTMAGLDDHHGREHGMTRQAGGTHTARHSTPPPQKFAEIYVRRIALPGP